jgi:hypothetical protein
VSHIVHHAIIVTCDEPREIEAAHREAVSLFAEAVTPIVHGGVNGCQSFMVAPRGSGLGYPQAEEHDELRKTFRRYLRDRLRLEWVEVRFDSEAAWVSGGAHDDTPEVDL